MPPGDGCAHRADPESTAPLRHAARSRRGFTLLEILLAIALIALLASALVGGAIQLTGGRAVSASEAFWQAVREARKAALQSGHDVRLKFDRERKEFFLVDSRAPAPVRDTAAATEEPRLKTFPIAAVGAEGLTMDFLGPSTQGGGSILIGGVLIESRAIPYVTFYADGTCEPFRAQFVRAGGSSILSIDPWTCAPVLVPPDPNAPPPP